MTQLPNGYYWVKIKDTGGIEVVELRGEGLRSGPIFLRMGRDVDDALAPHEVDIIEAIKFGQ